MRLAALDIAMQNPFAGTLADDESVTQNLMAQSVTLLPGIFSAKSSTSTLDGTTSLLFYTVTHDDGVPDKITRLYKAFVPSDAYGIASC